MAAIRTLSDFYFRTTSVEMQDQLEKFRHQYEARFGATDVTKRYTSTLPTEQQQWLLSHHPDVYWRGLPPFVQGFFRAQVHSACREGRLDCLPSPLIELYASGALEERGRDL